MANGFFLGGLASGFQKQEALNNQADYQQGLLKLDQQRLQNQKTQQDRDMFFQLQKQFLDSASTTINAAKESEAYTYPGMPPDALTKKVTNAYMPSLSVQIDHLEQMAKTLGIPVDVKAQVSNLFSTPVTPSTQLGTQKTQADIEKTKAGTKLINQTVENNSPPPTPTNPELDTDTQLGGADAEKKGQNFLNSLPGTRGLNAKGLYDGTTPITAFSTRTGKNNTKSQRQQAVEDAETYGALIGKPYNANVAANRKIADTAQNKADSSTLTQLTQNKQALSAFEDTAKNNTKVLLDLARKIPDTGSPLLNRPIRTLAKDATGNADVAAFNLQLQSVKNELSRIITNPRLVGQLTDSARSEMNAALDEGATVGMIMRAYQTVVKDFQNRSAGLDKSISEVKDRLSGKSKPPEHTYNPDTGELE